MKRKSANLLMVMILVMSITLITYTITKANATDPATIWTDKPDYAPGDVVTIYGIGFMANSNITVEVTRPDMTVNMSEAVSDEYGNFTTIYDLDGIAGTYTITATDGTKIATTTFTDAAPKIDTYKDSSCTILQDVFSRGDTVYANATGLDVSKRYNITWFNPSGTSAKTTQYVQGPTYHNDSYTLPSNAAIGEWKVKLFEWKATPSPGDWTLKDTALFYVRWLSFVSITASPTTIYLPTGTPNTTTVSVTVAGICPYEIQYGVGNTYIDVLQSGTTTPVTHLTITRMDATTIVTVSMSPYTYTLTFTVTTTATTSYTGLVDVYARVDSRTSPSDPWLSYTSTASNVFTISTPPATANVVFSQAGVSSDFTGTVLTIDGTRHLSVADFDGTNNVFTWTIGSSHTFAYASPLVVTPGSKQYAWTGTTSTGGLPTTQSGTINVPSGGGTITGNYKTQYNVTFSQSGLDMSATGTVVTINGTAKNYGLLPNSTWVDDSDKIVYTFEGIVASTTPADKQFRLKDVTGPASPITVTGAVTVTGNYIVQWKVTFDQSGVGIDFTSTMVTVNGADYGRDGVSFWADDGNVTSFSYASPLVVTANVKRYVLTGVDASSPLTITAATTVTGTYKTQWYVTFTSVGLDSSANGNKYLTVNLTAVNYPNDYSLWVNNSDALEFSYESTVAATATKRFILDDVDAISPLTVTTPQTVTATYKTQWYVTFAQTGVGTDFSGGVMTVNGTGYDRDGFSAWTNAGDVYVFSYASPLVVNGKRYAWKSTDATSPLTVDEAKLVIGTYHTEYYVTFTQTGVGIDFSGGVMTINGTGYDRAGHSDWYDDGDKLIFSYASPLVVTADVKRYVLTSVDASSPLTVSDAQTVTGTYHTEYYVTFSQSGVGTDFLGTVMTVNGTGHDRDGFSAWTNAGDVYVFSYASPLLVNGKRYVLIGVAGNTTASTLTVSAEAAVTGSYKIQYLLIVSTDPASLNPQPTTTLVSGYDAANGWYDADSVVSIDPDSPAGYTFDHWKGDASGSAVPLSVTMNSAKDIVAVFSFNLAVETGFKPGDSPSFASDPYLDEILCVLQKITTTSYKLVGTSPGTYDYAISIKNTGTTTFTSITITVKGNADHYLKSSNPIRVLDSNGNTITSQFTISGTWPTVTITSTSSFQGLRGSASLYVTIHLDYTKKGLPVSSTQFYNKGYTFTTEVTGSSGPNSGGKNAYGSVVFLSKKMTVIYGFAKTSSGTPIKGATIELSKDGKVYTVHTDEDGFYCFINGVEDDNHAIVTLSGGTIYNLKCTLPDATILTKQVTAQTNTAVQVLFTKP